MNELRFAIERTAYSRKPASQLIVCTVGIQIDGQPLASLARAVERPFADATGQPDLAGSYGGIRVVAGEITRDHFLGQPQRSWFDDGDTVLLGCECGEWGCWPLTASVAVAATEVVWERFRTGHRDWDLSAFGPFRFDRVRCEGAVDAAVSCIG